jgi:YceI-like domain
MKLKLIYLFALFISLPVKAEEFWNLPKELNDTNIKIKFEVDSTWHTVHGTTKNIKGELSLQDKTDPKSINGSIELPVIDFNTDNSSRDEKMLKVMHADNWPKVEVKFVKVDNICLPDTLLEGRDCSFIVKSKVKISGNEKDIDIPGKVVLESGNYKINGEVNLNWQSFGVEDPSIFIASVDPTVKIIFSIFLNK